MSLTTKLGSFINAFGVGDQSVTGVGFLGKLLLTISADATAVDTFGVGQSYGFGAARGIATDGTAQLAQAFASLWNDLLNRTNTVNSLDANLDLHEWQQGTSGSTTTVSQFRHLSFDADGFTVHRAEADNLNRHHYAVLGGSDLVVELFQVVSRPLATGVQVLTGASQRPTVAIFFAHIGSTGGAEGVTNCMGWFDGTNQGVIAVQANHVTSPGVCNTYQSAAHCLALLDPVTGALVGRAACTGFTADGLGLQWDQVYGVAGTFTVILLSGIAAKCGTVTQPAATGKQTTAVPGLAPQLILFASGNKAANASPVPDMRLSVGWSDGLGTDAGTWQADNNGASSLGTRRNLRSFRDTAITLAHPDTNTTAVLDAIATASHFDPTGSFDLDWTVTEGSPREVLYLALGPAVATPLAWAPPGPSVVKAIRRLRRAPHIWDGARNSPISYPGFKLIYSAGGVRTPNTQQLRFALQWSDDGGFTWSDLIWQDADTLGQYLASLDWRRLGSAVDRTFQVIDTNPAPTVLVDALLDPDPEGGT